MALRALLGCLLLAGCGGLPDPTISSVAPNDVVSTSITPVTITIDAVLPTRVNYGTREATTDNSAIVLVGTTDIGSSRVDATGTVSALVPRGLAPGTYDVIVQLGDKRRAVLPAGLTVR